MLKKSLLLLIIICNYSAGYVLAQPPAGYYNTTLGKSGNELKIALHNIIDAHTSISYSALWSAYGTTDRKPNGKIWDMYSDKPGATPHYEYNYSTDQCSSATSGAENDCYNREHIFPKSKFSSNYPMYSDLFFVVPSDAFVNGKKSDYTLGKVGAASFTSMNGSKVGVNIYPGAPTSNCFEPIDSFKGDFARSIFYVATRYWSEDGGWANWDLANGADLKPWAVQMLLEWHKNDPVSQKEINRNNNVYNIQHNRNPFIDYPEFVECIWSSGDCSSLNVSTPVNNQDPKINIFPNPSSSMITIQSDFYDAMNMQVVNVMGKIEMQTDAISDGTTVDISNLPSGIYLVVFSNKNARKTLKLVKK